MPKSSKTNINDRMQLGGPEWLTLGDIDNSALEEGLREHLTIPVSILLSHKDLLAMHRKYDYVFQDDFLDEVVMVHTIDEVMKLMKYTHFERLTDFIVPKLSHALRIEFAAILLTEYKIPKSAVSSYIDKLMQTDAFRKLSKTIDKRFNEAWPHFFKSHRHDLRRRSVDLMRKAFPEGDYPSRITEGEIINYYFSLLKLKQAKKLLFNLLSESCHARFIDSCQIMTFDKKPRISLMENRDLCILGFANNLMQQLPKLLMEQEHCALEAYVVIALEQLKSLDFNVQMTENSDESKLFRTSHTAILLMERVYTRVNDMVKANARPNVIIDANTLDKEWYKRFFCEPNALTHRKRESGVMSIMIECSDDFKETLVKGGGFESLDKIDPKEADAIYAEATLLNQFIKRLPQGYDIEFIDTSSEQTKIWANFNTSKKREGTFLSQLELSRQ